MKKSLIFTSFLLIFGLSTFSLAQTQVESGTWNVNSSFSGYTLDKNQGDRNVLIDINFEEPFDRKPDIVIAVTTIDASNQVNTRFSVKPMSVSRDGFTIKVFTWSDAKIFGIGGYWMAHAKAE
ncbi:MAG: H-type lectin domain-containing protein [Ignavibacteria bacterium]|jgi:hypothetical protein